MQTPPTMCRFSTMPTRRPSFAPAIAAFWPPGPDPRTSRSKSYAIAATRPSRTPAARSHPRAPRPSTHPPGAGHRLRSMTAEPLWVPLEGAVNVRDLGELPTDDGRRTVAGRLLRADNLQGLTPPDVRR